MFLVGLFLGVFIGPFALIVFFLPPYPKKDREVALITGESKDCRKCPYCAEAIRKETVKCRYCQSEVEPIIDE